MFIFFLLVLIAGMYVCDHIKSNILSFQCKRRFERDCKEADRAQQYFEKMDADINVTKADVEKVCVISLPSRKHQSCELVLYPTCLTQLPGLPPT